MVFNSSEVEWDCGPMRTVESRLFYQRLGATCPSRMNEKTRIPQRALASTRALPHCGRHRPFPDAPMANPLLAPVLGWLGRLRHPQLFLVTGLLFLVDLVIPDVVPFLDEILLATLTLWIGSRRRIRRTAEAAKETPARPS
ncbi:MAG TPA: hypothetical protein PLK29_02130 [Chiayiivirga sp.]|nr:hypothetical protein [Chiayiivirga sp.]